MSRIVTRSLQGLVDASVLLIALWAAFLLRFDGNLPLLMFKRAVLLSPYVVAGQYGLLTLFGVPRIAWRYVSLRDVRRILLGMATGSALLLCVRYVAQILTAKTSYAGYTLIPTGVICIDLAIGFLGVAGARVLRRIYGERQETAEWRSSSVEIIPTMLVGAGQAGVMVAREIASRPDLGLLPTGFIDDDKLKTGSLIGGVPVLGTTEDLVRLCRKVGAKQVLITIANGAGSSVRRITRLCEEAAIPVKIIPGVHEIVSGRVELSRIRPVTIEDLLGREPIVLDVEDIAAFIRGRTVLVSGAGGSIGSELCRQVCSFGPHLLVLVDRAENNLFEIHRDLVSSAPDVKTEPCIADVTDEQRLRILFARHKPEVVFHAAAHKHVPLMEENPGEAIKNNVFGTKTLADVSCEFGVAKFVMISTDKAVNPTSVMGATKRLAELYIQSLASQNTTRFVAVRFGNVLGSVGSVIPIFRAQIAKGGPVTVTHPEMKRYFMTIPEACQLVLQAGMMGQEEIFILDMGEPVKIVDLAHDLIRLSGLRPGVDIEVKFTGIRPGEKLFEEIAVEGEHALKTKHPKIFIGRLQPQDGAQVSAWLERLRNRADVARPEDLRALIGEIIPEYRVPVTSDTERPEPPQPARELLLGA